MLPDRSVDIEALGRLMKGAGVDPARAEAMIEDFLDRSMRENPIEYLRQEAVFLRNTLNNRLNEISHSNSEIVDFVEDIILNCDDQIIKILNRILYSVIILSLSVISLIFLQFYFRA